jgi:trehalose 6-phosphate phosphatase
MRSLRQLVMEFNVYRWAGRMMMDAARLRRRENCRADRRLQRSQLSNREAPLVARRRTGAFQPGRLERSFAFDFDGTLAPIVLQPDRARVATGVFTTGEACAPGARGGDFGAQPLRPSFADTGRCAPIGRQSRLRNCIETNSDLNPMRETCRQWLEQLRPRVDAYDDEGIFVEDKGITLSVHFRMARDRERAERAIADWILDLVPIPRVIGGKLVFNLLPAQARTKFEAVTDLAADESAEAALFVGDDLTDETVFEQAPSHWITVRVERDRNSRARFFIGDQSDVSNLLDRLIAMRTGDPAELRGRRTHRGATRS